MPFSLGEKKYFNEGGKVIQSRPKIFRTNLGENLEHKESQKQLKTQTTVKFSAIQFLTIHKLETLFRNFYLIQAYVQIRAAHG